MIFHSFSFDETTIAILTSPNRHGTHVEVQVDDVIFVGHTLGLEQSRDLKSFAVFFVLRVLTFLTIFDEDSYLKLIRLLQKHQLSYPIKK